jgi:ABC-type nitrate/sulfonate/bicarbonate transport system substrate-binding protein
MTAGTCDIRIVDAGGPHELVNLELMKSQGFLERFGVNPHKTYVTNGAAAARLVLSGECDAAMQVGFGPALSAIVRGEPLRVLGGSNLLTVHAVYSQQPDIRALKDLEGRTVGVGPLGALTHQLIYAALLKHGVDPARVRFVPMGSSSTIFKAMLAGEVEAGFGETDVFDNQARYRVHALEGGVLWRELPEFPNQASFASQTALREKRDPLVRILAAHVLLYRCLHSPDSWDAYAAAWTAALPEGADLEEARGQWQFYQDFHPYAEDLRLPENQVRYMQDLNVAMGLQDRILPYEAVTDMSLAAEALRMVGGAA